jgi:hypothetical protein
MRTTRIVAGVVALIGFALGPFPLLFAYLEGTPQFQDADFGPTKIFQIHKLHVALVGLGLWLCAWAGLFALSLPWRKLWRVQLLVVAPILVLATLSVAWPLPR